MAGFEDEEESTKSNSASSSSQPLSAEERTPKRLKFMEPDITVVVGEVEFYHYKQILCAACPFIDNMLSSGMKESQENKIEFPDQDPDQWLRVYAMLERVVSSSSSSSSTTTLSNNNIKESEAESIVEPLIQECVDGGKPMLNDFMGILSWLDYLGLDSLARQFDRGIAKYMNAVYAKAYGHPKYTNWCICKYLPCPLLQTVMKENVKGAMLELAYYLSQGRQYHQKMADYKFYLMDDICGEEMWEFLKSKVDFSETMLRQMDRDTIVEPPLFVYMVEQAARTMEKPGRVNVKWEDIIEKSSEGVELLSDAA